MLFHLICGDTKLFFYREEYIEMNMRGYSVERMYMNKVFLLLKPTVSLMKLFVSVKFYHQKQL